MQKGLKMTKQRIRQRLRRSGRASKVRAPEPAEDIPRQKDPLPLRVQDKNSC